MNSVYIYGRGVKGFEAYFCLRDNGIRVEYIIDNNESKQGPVLQGLQCISYERFLSFGDKNSDIVVSNKKSKEIVCRLQQDGFKKIYLWKDYKKQYRNQTVILRDMETVEDYLKRIKIVSAGIESEELIYGLGRDMEFRNRIKKNENS